MLERASGPSAGSAKPQCPICRRPSDPVLRPFCSKRCADVDLHRWLAGSYRVPTSEEPADGEADGAQPAP